MLWHWKWKLLTAYLQHRVLQSPRLSFGRLLLNRVSESSGFDMLSGNTHKSSTILAFIAQVAGSQDELEHLRFWSRIELEWIKILKYEMSQRNFYFWYIRSDPAKEAKKWTPCHYFQQFPKWHSGTIFPSYIYEARRWTKNLASWKTIYETGRNADKDQHKTICAYPDPPQAYPCWWDSARVVTVIGTFSSISSSQPF